MVYQILFEVEQGKKSAKEAQAALSKVKKEADGIEGSVKKLRKAFLQAFAVEELTRKVVQFTTEAINLARQAEGVQKAFSKLNDPNILNQLRAATRGTVSDLELMKAAVRAQNFKIPLQQLGTYFDFARQRARDTGQSVDYLVNSIIDGIGRKSTLVLDNLGLSAVDIQTEFGKTGDLAEAVGNIIKREMGDAGDATDGAADSIDRYNVSIENLKVKLGEQLLPVLGTVAEALNQIFFPSTLEVVKAYSQLREENEKVFEQVSKGFLRLGAGIEDAANLDKLRQAVDLAKSTGFGLQSLVSLREEGGKTVVAFTELGERITAQREAMERVKKPVEQLGVTVKDLQEKIKQLREEQLNTNIATSEGVQVYRDLEKEIEKIEERIKSLSEQKTLNDLIEIHPKTIESIKEATLLQRQLNLEYKSTAAQENEINGFLEKKLANQEKSNDSWEALNTVLPEITNAFANLTQAFEAGSKAQFQAAITQIILQNALALANAIQQAMTLPPPGNIAAAFSAVATVVGLFNQVKALQNEAESARANSVVTAAEGEIDIHRPGEVRGKDSIPALLMPGESVIKTTSTSKYKPFLEAIQQGNLEDLIRVNYVEPALAITAMEQAEKDSSIDYSQRFYKQLLATADGNSINRKSARTLESIDRKLSMSKYYAKRYGI